MVEPCFFAGFDTDFDENHSGVALSVVKAATNYGRCQRGWSCESRHQEFSIAAAVGSLCRSHRHRSRLVGFGIVAGLLRT